MINNIAKFIDQTNIEHFATEEDIKKTCQEAIKYNFRGVCVNTQWISMASRELKGSDIKTIALIDPPMGQSSHPKRVELCKNARKNGADELDIVINVIDMKYERYKEVLDDLGELCKILPTKVIIGSGYLTDKEIEKASELVKKAGAFCVKTATEKDPLEHIELKEKVKHLIIMKNAAPGLKIKASGKIQTLKDFKMMIKAGADIIGTSFGVKIVKAVNRCNS
jgi:deoxyribose-phosphate aldolase